jgi:acyl carrier protein
MRLLARASRSAPSRSLRPHELPRGWRYSIYTVLDVLTRADCGVSGGQVSRQEERIGDGAAAPPVDRRVRDVIIRTFRVGDALRSDSLRMGAVPGWDSLGHMQLVTELESEFGVTFAAYHLAELIDEGAIVRVIGELQAGK